MAMELLPRAAGSLFRSALSALRVVVVMGPRQAGKSTFVAHDPAAAGLTYRTLDDPDTMLRAWADPRAFIESGPAIIDEIQRVPELILAVKAAVDEPGEQRTGQFVLTGSANLLSMHRVPDSLAGRAFYLQLWPMTRREQLGLGRTGIWSVLLDEQPLSWIEALHREEPRTADWRSVVFRGGFPEPAVLISDEGARELWFQAYIGAYLMRDLREQRQVQNFLDVERLMRAAALRIGNPLNITELSRDTQIPATTVRDYLTLLATTYQIVCLEAYAKRLIKTPKVYWNDAAVGLHLAGGEAGGAHFENLVLIDLLAWRDSIPERAEITYWRTTTGAEVDFVVERGGRLLGIEVKTTARPHPRDARGLRFPRRVSGERRRGCAPALRRRNVLDERPGARGAVVAGAVSRRASCSHGCLWGQAAKGINSNRPGHMRSTGHVLRPPNRHRG